MINYSDKFQSECAKYLSSEGIYYRRYKSTILACINGQFVRFVFVKDKMSRKLAASGGLENRPRSLYDFIKTVRDIQNHTKGRA